MSARPFISVVIPSYNRRWSLLEVVAALRRQTYPADAFEVIVVLDGSDDGSREALAAVGADDRLRLFWQSHHGASRARNRGAAAARGELLVFLDDDVVPVPDLLAAHARTHREGLADVVLGRLLLAAVGSRSVLVEREEAWYAHHFAELAEPDHRFSCWDFFAGNVSLARRDFVEAGGFDETFTTYGCEDWEFGLRLLEAGRRFAFCADAVGVHRWALDFAGWQHHAYWDGRSEVRFVRKHPEIKTAMHLVDYYQRSLWRRVGRRALSAPAQARPPLITRLTHLYTWAEQTERRRLALLIAKLIWTCCHWSGLADELGGTARANQFVGFRVPVLVYHRVTDRPHPALAEYAVSPRTLRRQLAWLRATGHQVITLATLYDAYRGAAELPRRPVAITFDDGYEDTATTAAPILREFGYPATLFVVADRVGGWNSWDSGLGPPLSRLLDWQQLRTLAASGIEIGGHSATHARLPGLGDVDLTHELSASREEISRQLGRPVDWFAYPHGEHDRRVRQATRAAGYRAGFTFEGGLAGAGDDLFQLARVPVGESDGIAGLACKLATGDDWWTALKRHTPAPLRPPVRTLARRIQRQR